MAETLATIKCKLTVAVEQLTIQKMYGVKCDTETLLSDADRFYKYQLIFESGCWTDSQIKCLIDNKI